MSRAYARLDDDTADHEFDRSGASPGVTSPLQGGRFENDIGDREASSPWNLRSSLNPTPTSGAFSPGIQGGNGARSPPYRDQLEMSNLDAASVNKNPTRISLKSRLSTFSTVKGHGLPPEFVRWGVGWRQPLAMVLLFFAGVGTCFGHHIYYNYHIGRQVGDSTNQNVIVAIGTGFTFLALFFLNSANGIAFTQYIWIIVKRHHLKVGTLDKLFGIPSDITAFLSWELLKKAKFALFLAGITWCMTLTGVIPPGTLSITNGLNITTGSFNVTGFNFTMNNHELMILQTRAQVSWQQPGPQILRLASQVAQNARPIQLTAPAVNLTYTTQFLGPGLQCKAANSSQQVEFDAYNADVLAQTSTYNVQQFLKATNLTHPPYYMQYYSAFSPQLHKVVTDFPDPDGTVDTYGNWEAMGLSDRTRNRFWAAQYWIQLANTSLVCTLTNTSYDITFKYVNSVQTIVQNNVTHLNEWSWASGTNDPNYFGYMAAIGPMLYGNMTVASYSCNITQPDNTLKLGHCYMPSSSNSRISLTGMTACDDFVNSWWEENVDKLDPVHSTPSQPFVGNSEYNACRNGSLAKAIEDLGANVTITMLGIPLGDFHNLTIPKSVNGTTSLTINVYDYDKWKLWVSYLIAIAAAFFMTIVGIISFYINGVSHNASFSAIMSTTRNKDLDHITKGQSLGRPELRPELDDTQLKFGVGEDITVVETVGAGLGGLGMEDEGMSSGSGFAMGVRVRRLTFGLKGRVGPLRKGERYI